MSLALEGPVPLKPDIGPHNGRRRYRRRIPGEGLIGGQRLLIWLVLNFQRIIAPVGRRFGKTTGLLFIVVELAARVTGICYVGIWSQDNDKAKELMEVFIQSYGGWITKIHRSQQQNRYIEVRSMGGSNTGIRIYFWSAEAHNRVRGYTHPFHLIVSDESSYIRANAVLKVSLKMLADCGGKFLAIGTPDLDGVGFAWFSTFWRRAMSPSVKWSSWSGMNFPSEANPTISLDNIKTMRDECITKEEEQQEVDAMFLEDTSSVFGTLKHCFTLSPFDPPPPQFVTAVADANLSRRDVDLWVHDKPRLQVPYVIGVDWGRKQDQTIITVWRQDTRREVARFALSGADWTEQMDFLIRVRYLYNDCSIYSDAHGVGDGMTQILRSKFGEDVVAVTWGGMGKEQRVRRLEALIQNTEIRFIDIPECREQFRIYQGEKNEKTGRVRFASPDGEHDDHVDATLLLTEPLLLALSPSQDEDGAGTAPDRPKPGTMSELRAELDRIDYMEPAQIGPWE